MNSDNPAGCCVVVLGDFGAANDIGDDVLVCTTEYWDHQGGGKSTLLSDTYSVAMSMVTLATAKVFLKILYPPLISLITSVLFCALQIPGPSVWKLNGLRMQLQTRPPRRRPATGKDFEI